jgi:hypothetical protein
MLRFTVAPRRTLNLTSFPAFSCFFMAKRTVQALFYLSLRFPESLQLHRRRHNSGCLAAESLGALCHHRRDTLLYVLATLQLRLAGDCNPSSSL